jgi:hypothetical protein
VFRGEGLRRTSQPAEPAESTELQWERGVFALQAETWWHSAKVLSIERRYDNKRHQQLIRGYKSNPSMEPPQHVAHNIPRAVSGVNTGAGDVSLSSCEMDCGSVG